MPSVAGRLAITVGKLEVAPGQEKGQTGWFALLNSERQSGRRHARPFVNLLSE